MPRSPIPTERKADIRRELVHTAKRYTGLVAAPYIRLELAWPRSKQERKEKKESSRARNPWLGKLNIARRSWIAFISNQINSRSILIFCGQSDQNLCAVVVIYAARVLFTVGNF